MIERHEITRSGLKVDRDWWMATKVVRHRFVIAAAVARSARRCCSKDWLRPSPATRAGPPVSPGSLFERPVTAGLGTRGRAGRVERRRRDASSARTRVADRETRFRNSSAGPGFRSASIGDIRRQVPAMSRLPTMSLADSIAASSVPNHGPVRSGPDSPPQPRRPASASWSCVFLRGYAEMRSLAAESYSEGSRGRLT